MVAFPVPPYSTKIPVGSGVKPNDTSRIKGQADARKDPELTGVPNSNAIDVPKCILPSDFILAWKNREFGGFMPSIPQLKDVAFRYSYDFHGGST